MQFSSDDLDNGSFTSLKVHLINFFKYCLSSSELYAFNKNLYQSNITTQFTYEVIYDLINFIYY